jgi:hypothetical protein
LAFWHLAFGDIGVALGGNIVLVLVVVLESGHAK